MIGSRLGPYEITATLGAGGMGEVYRAQDTRLGREVAIKVLPAELAGDERALARFEREARAVAALSHPNILALHDFDKAGEVVYAVMELLDGESLRSRLSSGPLPVRKAIDYAAQIARGLAAAHERGIVHRDLKPANIFVTRDEQVKILDFGLAKRQITQQAETLGFDDHTGPGTVLGTVGYMAPEQVRGEEADARSDIFAFGAVFYEMITGERAFRGDSAVETMSAILKEEPEELAATGRRIPPELERIVHHCLEKEPAVRFQSARDLAFDIDALTGVTGTAHVSVVPDRRRVGRWVRPVGIALVVACVAGALGWWLHGRTSPTAGALDDVSVRQLTFGHRWILNARYASAAGAVVFSQLDPAGTSRIGVLRTSSPEPELLPFEKVHLLSVSSTSELAVLTKAVYINHRLFVGTLARMPLAGGAPKEILEGVREADWSPDGSRLAILHTKNRTDQLEYPVGTVLVTSTGYLSDLRISPDGTAIAFFEHPVPWDDRGVVRVLDIASGTARSLTGEFFLLEGLAWSRDGREIFFSGQQEGEGVGTKTYGVTRDGASMRAVLVGFGLDQVVDVGPEGELLVLREETVKSIFSHRGANDSDRLLRTGASYYQLAMTADGSRLCYTDERVDAGRYYSVILRATDGSPAIRIGEGWCADLSADGKWVLGVVSRDPPEIWAYPTGPGQPIQLAPGRFSALGGAAFTRDGESVVACGELAAGGHDCSRLPLDGGPPESLGLGDAFAALPSPDGRRYVALAGGPGPDELVSRGKREPIPGLRTDAEGVVGWSPGGEALRVVGGLPPGGFYVDRLSLVDGSRTRLVERRWPPQARASFDFTFAMGADPTDFAYGVRDSQSQLYAARGVR